MIMFILGRFFFQAEDSIRDWSVTGVQTCALPISLLLPSAGAPGRAVAAGAGIRDADRGAGEVRAFAAPGGTRGRGRSEERRVGKECRTRWTPPPSTESQAVTTGTGQRTKQHMTTQ